MTTILVHVVPRARVTEVAGRYGDAVRIRVAAPPVDGAANAELVWFVAKRLGVPRSAVRITGGASGRRKTLSVDGVTREATEARLLAETP